MPQVKMTVSREVLENFKKIVLAKHGKLELSPEGEEALKLYIRRYERLLTGLVHPEEDPLKEVVGIARSVERHNVLQELKMLEAGET